MKKEKKDIKKIAEEILQLEKECQQGNNIQENMDKMVKITNSLSFIEILAIDEYLSKKNFF